MKKYRLDIIIQAASFFAQEEGAVENFAHDIKKIQSSKDECSPKDVKDVDEQTLVQAMIGKTETVNDVVFGILKKYEEILTADGSSLFNQNALDFIQSVFLKKFLLTILFIYLGECFLSLKNKSIRL